MRNLPLLEFMHARFNLVDRLLFQRLLDFHSRQKWALLGIERQL